MSPAFIARLGTDGYTFANAGTCAFTSSDSKFTNTRKGDGKTKIAPGSRFYDHAGLKRCDGYP
ncbi:putative lipoprotein [Burkholderia cepacia GG4]|uniref:Lipoprotein n=1 Tax=Burkholderia cepacia GG4 TaxID=1009846 RepID=A0A9W3PCM2_BURCE|nr:putative lipoprotein [Burkholderia cepacia GG4]